MGQRRIQHPPGPPHYRFANIRSSKASTWAEEKDWTLHNVWARRFVSICFQLLRNLLNAHMHTDISSCSVCITSMVRLWSIKSFGLTADPTWDNIPITFWTTLETTTAVLCSCLPMIRAGLLRLFPQFVGGTANASFTTITGNKPTILVQKSFASSSTAKSWPAQKLTSISSLSMRDEDARPTTNYSEVMQDLELAKLNSGRFGRQ